MSVTPSSSLLAEILDAVARRYRLPALAAVCAPAPQASPATVLALAIEQAREASARGQAPDAASQRFFIEALARMIREAMRDEAGDPVFQAMLLRHRSAVVREYASLAAHASVDRRLIYAAVNAIAHPAKQQRLLPGLQRDALARLHALALAEAWPELGEAVQACIDTPQIAHDAALQRGLAQLIDSAALQRLRRLDALTSDERVCHYRSLWDRQGPRPGSSTALARGLSSKQRGAAVEASATDALEALARRLNDAQGAEAAYRVVNSMRVPATIPASHERAKTEWDVVLLREAQPPADAAAWDVCLLVEAKASVDAATTDLPRLVRGLTLLAHADPHTVYSFRTQQGAVRLSGASLAALTSDRAGLRRTVLYCCDAPVEAAPRVLSPASRMQLLSAHASLDFASALADGRDADCAELEPVWRHLLESPRWRTVLDQYATLREVRELMVHPDDLRAAIGVADASRVSAAR
ncbi:3-deoxy-D-arabino-heptulosonate 7-phosphate synthase [Paraburkholderia sprentiae WSM5005]|uniref:3-deoxy-D-arabino-heptulosonate 7-phosphate synthase n=1 Tax=Paraburkholderia sprentiae WSM5005 TaxID=754502 RepID=A0A1I9YFL9_9BURK|nr:3-deoxy-D-arabino-heptulosonate 7-phosphate synthase [Paraburkholderia sprentiae]APA85102.1 3-deoxy-D-arabino-heptulosonate 7-phosphate synthase [Paraburkholderia sprentiae WSM5005]